MKEAIMVVVADGKYCIGGGIVCGFLSFKNHTPKGKTKPETRQWCRLFDNVLRGHNTVKCTRCKRMCDGDYIELSR
jgi:hypothetical protein